MTKDSHVLSWGADERHPVLTPVAIQVPIGTSESIRAVMRQVEKIARSDAPVLIQGETGSGKELVARAIWSRSARRAGPFVPVNCGAIPDGLIETELFGHGAGAFTDARQARDGVIAQAQHGSLFLDEINTLSPRAQVTLLRFLQDLRYRRVGTSTECAADVRIFAASNQPLQDLVDARQFRRDLVRPGYGSCVPRRTRLVPSTKRHQRSSSIARGSIAARSDACDRLHALMRSLAAWHLRCCRHSAAGTTVLPGFPRSRAILLLSR